VPRPSPRPLTPDGASARPLAGLIAAQALGMVNDNLLKMAVILLLIGPRATETAQQDATFSGFLAYTLPYVLLSLPAGLLADAWSKRRVLLALKGAEIAAMLLAGWALHDGRPGAVLAVLAAAGALGALSSPAKYGAIPELVAPERLTRGNGQFLLATWIAIIVGTGLAGFLLDLVGPTGRWQIGVLLAALAVAAFVCLLRMPALPARSERTPVLRVGREGWREILASPHLRLAFAGSTYFWTLCALVQQDVVVYSKSALELSDTAKSLLQAGLAAGVGLGGLACGLLTYGRLGLRWIHRGLAGMAVVLASLAFLPPNAAWAAPLLVLLGMGSGFVLTPLNALVQARSRPEHRGAVIAVLNVSVFSGILLGSLAGASLGRTGLASTSILGVAAGFALLGAGWAFRARARLPA
jgi:acyl-[acyl-carrier-protein]-phospholipid O-acyltransferase/long-chain-fatty-acid--[acyl-carrier-protein] ligase